MRKLGLVVVALAVVGGLLLARPTPTNPPVSDVASDSKSALTPHNILREINNRRVATPSLQGLASLETSANEKAVELYREWPDVPDKTPHVSNGGKPGTDILLEHTKCRFGAENIGWYQKTAQEVVEDWYSSPPHREAMLSSKYSTAGISINHQYIVLHLCGQRVSAENTFNFDEAKMNKGLEFATPQTIPQLKEQILAPIQLLN